MAGIHSRPTTPGGTIEDLRFGVSAAAGSLTEPGATHRADGWAWGEKPSYKEFNYTSQKLWRWMARLRGVGLFLEAHTFQIEIMATGAIGYVRTLTIAGVPVSYTTQAGDTTAIIATRWAAQMNADATFSGEYDIYLSGASTIYFVCRTPAKTPVMFIVDVNAVLTTLIAAPYKVRLADDDLTYKADVDLVFGSSSTEDTGSAADDARFLFDKSKAAARFGRVNGTQWDDASRGDASMAWGENCTASGAHSTAGGSSCLASGARSIAIGSSNTASGADSIAVGTGNTASGINACAIGSGCTASANASTAIGQGATAGKQNAVAIGMGNAQGQGSVAIGGQGFNTADAMDDDDVAIGTGALANNNAGARAALAVGADARATAGGAIAIGPGTRSTAADATTIGTGVEASGDGSLATGHGYTGSDGRVVASGRGSRAHGAPDNVAGHDVKAIGENAVAEGSGCVATPNRSRAIGVWAVPTMLGEMAFAGNQPSGLGGAFPHTQYGTVHAFAETVDANPAVTPVADLQAGGGVAWTPLDNGVYQVRVQAVAYRSDVAGSVQSWEFSLSLSKIAGVIAFGGGGAQMVVGGLAGQVGFGANLTATWGGAAVTLKFNQNGAGAFQLIATGIAAETWQWAARMDYTRMGIGA